VAAGGRKAARQARRLEREEELRREQEFEASLIEFTARRDGEVCEYRGRRDAAVRIADELRAEGWLIVWSSVVPAPAARWPW
jgi:hypothetical protein